MTHKLSMVSLTLMLIACVALAAAQHAHMQNEKVHCPCICEIPR